MKFFSRKRAKSSFETFPTLSSPLVNLTAVLGLSAILLLSSACGADKDLDQSLRFDGQELILGMRGEPEHIPFTDVYQKLKVVPLENHPEAKLGNINKIIFNEDWIVVLAPGYRKIFIFDREGNFLNKIEQDGKYRGMNLSDVTFSANDSTFYYLNTGSQQIVEYHVEEGIRKTIDDPLSHAWSLSITPEQDLLLFSPLSAHRNGEGKVGLTNRFAFLSKDNGEILRSLSSDIAPEKPRIIQRTNIRNSGVNTSFKSPYCDTIYHINSNHSITPHLVVKAPEGEIIHQRPEELLVGLLNQGGSYLFEGHLENDKYLFFTYTQGMRTYRGIIDKATRKYHHLAAPKPNLRFGLGEPGLELLEDKHSLQFFPNFYSHSQSSGKEDMMYVSATKFLKFLAQSEGNIPSFIEASSTDRLRQLQEGSNPVLLIAQY